MKDWKNILLLFCSLLLFFGVSEITVRLLWSPPTHDLYQVRPDQMHLIPNTEGIYKTSEFQFKVISNRFGRRDWEWTDSVMDDPCNFIFVGDSFVFGYGVNDSDTVPTLLEGQFAVAGRKTEVFNFGLGGGLPEYRELAEEGINVGIQARTLIVGIFLGNDLTESVDNRIQPSDRLIRVPRLSDSALYQLLKFRVSSSTVFTSLAFRVGRVLHLDMYPTSVGYIFLKDWTANQRSIFYSMLSRILEIEGLGKRNGRRVVFVIFPNRIQVENAKDLTSSVYDADLPDERIIGYCAENGIACIDLLPTLRTAYEHNRVPLFFPVDRHMSASGNRVAALAISEYLRDNRMLCSSNIR